MPDQEKRYKHLTEEDRQEIQDCLNHGMTFKQIARRIGKDQTTVSKEVTWLHLDASASMHMICLAFVSLGFDKDHYISE